MLNAPLPVNLGVLESLDLWKRQLQPDRHWSGSGTGVIFNQSMSRALRHVIVLASISAQLSLSTGQLLQIGRLHKTLDEESLAVTLRADRPTVCARGWSSYTFRCHHKQLACQDKPVVFDGGEAAACSSRIPVADPLRAFDETDAGERVELAVASAPSLRPDLGRPRRSCCRLQHRPACRARGRGPERACS